MINEDKAKGFLVAICKKIRLTEPPDASLYRHGNFFPGPINNLGSIAVSWWIPLASEKDVDGLAKYVKDNVSAYQGYDSSIISTQFQAWLKQVCANNKIFDQDLLLLKRVDTLFETRNDNGVKIFSGKLLVDFLDFLKDMNLRWILVFPVPRIHTDTFEISDEKIHVFNKIDTAAWSNLSYQTKFWEPISGTVNGRLNWIKNPEDYHSFIAVETTGTDEFAVQIAELKLKQIVAITMAQIFSRDNLRLQKSGGQSLRGYALIAQDKNTGEGYIVSFIDEVIPYYLNEQVISPDIAASLKTWYSKKANMNEELNRRLDVALHFFNNGLNSKGIDAYIHFFILLDALFGEMYKVERKITEGVNALVGDVQLKKKLGELYDLRNEIVHGGSRSIEEWVGFPNYKRKYSSLPLDDLFSISVSCLINYPDYVPRKSGPSVRELFLRRICGLFTRNS